MAFRLLAITDPGCAISTRYRVAQFEPYLRQQEICVETLPWPRGAAERASLLEAVPAADAVLFQRILPTRGWLREVRQRARRLVFDFDDAIIRAESTRGRPRWLLNRWWRFRAMMRCCDAVTAGNSHLAELAQREAAHVPVGVVPTTIELERYDREPAQMDATPVVGWIGGRWTLPYLAPLRRPLEQLRAEIAGLNVRVIADEAPDIGNVRVELIPWAAETEVRELKRLRAGVAPLPDDAWTRGKCGLRLLQYLAAGIPAVASPVGAQAEIIRAGAALPAASDSEWHQALRRVLTDQTLAADLTACGRGLVRERFSTSSWADRVRESWCGKNERVERVSPAS
jgi:glycosyltransferase involved in cell wall biosynthesis